MCGLVRLQHELLEVGQQLILAGHVHHQLSDQVEEILVDQKMQNLNQFPVINLCSSFLHKQID